MPLPSSQVYIEKKMLLKTLVFCVFGEKRRFKFYSLKHVIQSGGVHAFLHPTNNLKYFTSCPQRGLIRTPDDVFMINPLPDRLGLERNKTRAHVIHRRSTSSLEDLGEALRVEKRSENWCGVEGECSDQNFSLKSRVFGLRFMMTYTCNSDLFIR